MRVIDKNEALLKFNDAVRRKGAVVLAGAGISMVGKSKLPSGNELKKHITRNILTGILAGSEMHDIFENEGFNKLIPEVLFQVYFEILGQNLYEGFEVLKNSIPNHIHAWLAEKNVSEGLPVLTTNFDSLIEKVESSAKVEHLHGDLAKPEEMFIRIYQITKGIEYLKMRKYVSAIGQKEMYVFGYSGNDLDVIGLINKSEVKNIYWMMLDVNDVWVLSNLSRISKSKKLFIYEADLAEFFPNSNKSIANPAIDVGFTAIGSPYRHIERGQRICCLQSTYFVLEQYEKALSVAQSGLGDDNNSDFINSWLHQVAADNLTIIGKDFASAIKHMDKAIDINSRSNNLVELAECLNAKGNIYNQKEIPDYKETLRLFEDAEKQLIPILDKLNQ